jgi:hypothetical protein
MSLGGKSDQLFAQASTVAAALQQLSEKASAEQHPGARALIETHAELDEAINTTASKSLLSQIFGRASGAAAALLKTPVKFNAAVAALYDAVAPAFEQLGHVDLAEGLMYAAAVLRGEEPLPT